MKLLEIVDLSVWYGDVQALWNVSIDVQPGEIISVVGANGSGKTTALNTISGLIMKHTGAITFSGNRIENLPPHQVVEMGLVQIPEGRRIFPHMTVLENLELGSFTPKARASFQQNLKKVYSLFSILEERKDQRAGTLSGGEQQMLAVGRGLMSAPRLLMFDEPSLGLAPIITDMIFETVVNINRQGLTILLVEQDVHESLSIANRGYVLEVGRITLDGDGKTLLNHEHIQKAFLGM